MMTYVGFDTPYIEAAIAGGTHFTMTVVDRNLAVATQHFTPFQPLWDETYNYLLNPFQVCNNDGCVAMPAMPIADTMGWDNEMWDYPAVTECPNGYPDLLDITP